VRDGEIQMNVDLHNPEKTDAKTEARSPLQRGGRQMKRLLAIFGAVLISVATSGDAWAQATAQISGTVKDQSGAVLPGVEIAVTQTDTGVARTAVTNETGSYALPNLPLGPYRLEAALPGFRTFVQTGIVLQVNANLVINPLLEVGQVSQQVEVEANAALVETRSAGVGQVMENVRILDLPLNGRNVTDLILLSGGTTPGTNISASGRDVFNNGVTPVAIAGGLSYGVAYTLDGAMHNNPFSGLALSVPFPDALQEFKIETSAISASSGGIHSAGLVSLVTKSGTNQIHGDLFEFVRNQAFNARNAFSTSSDALKRNQFGGTIGGPIKQGKLFYFGAYQGTRIRQSSTNIIGIVPTAAMVAGDFTAFTSAACNGGRQITLRAPFVNNQTSTSNYSPAALAFVSKIPGTTDPCGRLTYGNPVSTNQNTAIGKVDYQRSAKQSIFVRYLIDDIVTPPPYRLNHNLLSANVTTGNGRSQALTLSDTYVFRPNLLNALRLTANRSSTLRAADDTFSPCDIGINIYCGYRAGVFGQQKVEKIVVSGGIAANGSAGPTAINVFGISDDVNWTHGNHQIAFGGALSYWRSDWGGCIFCSPNININGQTTGTGYSDLLTGNVASMIQSPPDIIGHYEWYVGPYIADTWKMTSRLTANVGLRWEPFFPMVPWTGESYNLSLDAISAGVRTKQYVNAPPGLTYPGDSAYPMSGKGMMRPQYGNISPRVGLAWDVKGDGRTSVRASFGTFHDVVNANFPLAVGAPPFQPSVPLFGVKLDNPWANQPGGNPFPASTGANAPFPPFSNYEIWMPNTKNPEITQWNLSVQKQLATNWLVSASYLGTSSTHLWMINNINGAVYLGLGPCTLNGVQYTVCSTTGNTNQRRPLSLAHPAIGQSYGLIYQIDNGGTGNYNGLVISGQHRLSGGFTVNANYTWSHCMSDPITPTINTLQTTGPYTKPNNPKFDRGNCNTSATDIRHAFSLTGVVQSPSFANRTLRLLGTGWSLAPILRIRSGVPLTLITTSDVALSGIGNQRVSQVSSEVYGRGLQYLNPAAFALPAPGSYANIPPGKFFGPGYWGLDIALSRAFNVGKEGRRKIEARGEAFNLTNSFRGLDPVVNFSSGQFGQIVSANDPRILQFALKYVF
jgi:carboxypeptidase family protein